MTPLIAFTVPGLRVKSLNSREHWRPKAKRVAKERKAVAECWLTGKRRYMGWQRGPAPYDVLLTRVGPGFMDSDNVVGALKHVRDEVACRLGVDDGDDSTVSWRYAQKRGPYAVRVEVYQRAQLPGGAFWSRNPPTLCCDIKALYPAADLKREAKQFSAVDDPNPPVKAALLKREATRWKVLGTVDLDDDTSPALPDYEAMPHPGTGRLLASRPVARKGVTVVPSYVAPPKQRRKRK